MNSNFSHHALKSPNHESAGLPFPDDIMENCFDLNAYLIKNTAASFFVRVSGSSMKGVGILDGDILLVDRSLEPGHNKIVVAIVNNEMTLKRLSFIQDKVYLVPENKNYPPIEITEHMDCSIWGVVSAVIRKL